MTRLSSAAPVGGAEVAIYDTSGKELWKGKTDASGLAGPKKKDSAEVFVNGEFIAVLFREEDEGETSYQFQMAILDVDLEQV